MSNKEPKTTEFPNWEQLRSEYLEQVQNLELLISGLRALQRDPSELKYDLERLQQRIEAIDQMQAVVARHHVSVAHPQAA